MTHYELMNDIRDMRVNDSISININTFNDLVSEENIDVFAFNVKKYWGVEININHTMITLIKVMRGETE